MHDQAGAGTTYLVEHYRPGVTAEELARSAALVRQAAAALQLEGKPLRFVFSTIVPGDESLLCLLEAASERLVRDTYARAGIPYERVSTAITQASPAGSAPCTDSQSGPTLRPQERGESR
jgi:hypothetical protein